MNSMIWIKSLNYWLKWIRPRSKTKRFGKKYAELEDIYKNKEAELNSLIAKKNEIKLKVSKFNIFIETLKKGELITDFDEAIFNFNLEKAIVHKDKSKTFKIYSGFETTIKAEEWFLGLFALYNRKNHAFMV